MKRGSVYKLLTTLSRGALLTIGGMMKDDIEEGNFNESKEKGDGVWKVGHFAKRPNFKTDKTEFQWVHEMLAGEHKKSTVYYQQSSTLTVLIEGKIEIIFPHSKNHPKVILKEHGAYNFFGPNVCHTWKAIKKTTLVSVRWPSIPDDQVKCDHKD
jgi:hypothetical protein